MRMTRKDGSFLYGGGSLRWPYPNGAEMGTKIPPRGWQGGDPKFSGAGARIKVPPMGIRWGPESGLRLFFFLVYLD